MIWFEFRYVNCNLCQGVGNVGSAAVVPIYVWDVLDSGCTTVSLTSYGGGGSYVCNKKILKGF